MLTRLQVRGFKNLVDVDVRFGPFTCIAGSTVPLPDRAMNYPAWGTQDLTAAERATGLPWNLLKRRNTCS